MWNKLFRKAFWDASGLSFPEGMLWEDLQAMTRAHVLARAVDVIPDTIYYWRERGKGQLSITQSRTDITNFRDRITALTAIDRFLAERGSPKLLREHQRKALLNDLWLYVSDLSRTSDEYQAEFLELTGKYLAQVDRRVLAKLPSTHKLAYYLVATRQLDQLIEFNAWQQGQPIKTIPVVRRFGRLRADLPFRKDRALKIPGRIYRPHWRELDPFVRVERISWEGTSSSSPAPRSCLRSASPSAGIRPRSSSCGRRPAAAADRHDRPVGSAFRGHHMVGPEALLLRLGGLPPGDQPEAVPDRPPLADRGLGQPDPGQGARRVAAGPAAHSDPRLSRTAGIP